MSSPRPIVVRGPQEGRLTLTAAKHKVSGSFVVSLADLNNPTCIVLYRLRVKESSILFSKTYGILEVAKGGGTDSISIFADKVVAQSGRLSTIRVEYLVISSADAETVRMGGVDKGTCRPFFQRSGVRTYDVSCTVKASKEWLKYLVIAGAVLAGAVGVVAVVKRRREGPTSSPAKIE